MVIRWRGEACGYSANHEWQGSSIAAHDHYPPMVRLLFFVFSRGAFGAYSQMDGTTSAELS